MRRWEDTIELSRICADRRHRLDIPLYSHNYLQRLYMAFSKENNAVTYLLQRSLNFSPLGTDKYVQ